MRAMMKIWVSGASGQVGTAITDVADPLAFELLNTDVEELDITEIDEVLNFAELNRPDVIINCAGITDVALCEKNPELAYKVNALGARNLSIAARKIGAKLVQISTDDVFDGQSSEPYCEFDDTNPKTVYGRSKRAGENYVKEFTEKHFIIRSNWIYGKGKNFVSNLLERVKTEHVLPVASDQFGSPTSANDLARLLLELMDTNLPYYGEGNLQPVRVCKRDSEVDRS
jgi:dTDP-4-dehydrorhamnose reductase